MKRDSGIVLVGGATALVGVAGYVITWLVPRYIGFENYATFAVFWAFVFLLVAALSGVQQEVTRATRPRDRSSPESRGREVWALGASFSACVFALIVATAPLWVELVFPSLGWSLVWPLAAGAASYIFVAVITGSFYGIAEWRGIFWIVILEGMLRLIAVAAVLVWNPDLVSLSWAVVIPFPLAALLLVRRVRRALLGQTILDVRGPRLAWNSIRTMVAAGSMGLLISGFPLVLGMTSQNEPAAIVGLLILATTLVRAPLIVTAMALQSYLIVYFRARQGAFWKAFLTLQGVLTVVGGALSIAGYLLGPAVFEYLFPGEPVPPAAFVAVLFVSSTLVGALCVSAPAVLARGQHMYFALGWVLAAATTVVALMLPLDIVLRTTIAVTLPPLLGVATHVGCLVFIRGSNTPPVSVPSPTAHADGI